MDAFLVSTGFVALAEIGDRSQLLGRRSFGLALILTAIPGFVPGLSSAVGPLFAAAFVALGTQMMAGRQLPRLPDRLPWPSLS